MLVVCHLRMRKKFTFIEILVRDSGRFFTFNHKSPKINKALWIHKDVFIRMANHGISQVCVEPIATTKKLLINTNSWIPFLPKFPSYIAPNNTMKIGWVDFEKFLLQSRQRNSKERRWWSIPIKEQTIIRIHEKEHWENKWSNISSRWLHKCTFQDFFPNF